MAKSKKFLTSVSYSHDVATSFEHVPGESLTVQGESYTIAELFDRHMKGQVVNIERETYYEDTQNFDSIDFGAIRYADPFEKQQLLLDVEEKAKKARLALEKYEKEQKDEATKKDAPPASTPSKKTKSSDAGESGERASERSEESKANSDEPTNKQ